MNANTDETAPMRSSPLQRWSALGYTLLLVVFTCYAWVNVATVADLSALAYLYFGCMCALGLLFAIPGTALLWRGSGSAIVPVIHLVCAVAALGNAVYWTFLSAADGLILTISWAPVVTLVLTAPSTAALWWRSGLGIVAEWYIPCAVAVVAYVGTMLYTSPDMALTVIPLVFLAPAVAIAGMGFTHWRRQPGRSDAV